MVWVLEENSYLSWVEFGQSFLVVWISKVGPADGFIVMGLSLNFLSFLSSHLYIFFIYSFLILAFFFSKMNPNNIT